MFGPNTIGKKVYSLNYSHRDKEFISLYKELTCSFKNNFDLHEYDILFLPGSGTIGIESLISSCVDKINLIGPNGKFKNRWLGISNRYSKNKKQSINMFCQLETSNSNFFSQEGCVIDAISSFPYYDMPKNTLAFITCSNKQLGAFPGLSIIGIHKNFWHKIRKDEQFSYLNLALHRKFAEKHQTLTTAPTPVYEHLLDNINNFDLNKLKEKINHVSRTITELFGKEDIIGEKICPVITIKKNSVPINIATKYQLYGLNNPSTDNYQIFTYSHPREHYEDFIKDLKK